MADRLTPNGTLTWLRPDRLTVDSAYQRPINRRKVRKIVAQFSEEAFGCLYISKRTDGSLVILDGLQRHTAVMEKDPTLPVACMVFVGLTQAEEAGLFYAYNEVRTKPRPMELHRAAVIAGQKRAVEVEATVQALGLILSDGNTAGYIQCVSTLNGIYDQAGRDILRRTLRIMHDAFGQNAAAYNSEFIQAVAVVLARHDIDDDRMSRVVAKMNVPAVVQKARVLRCQLGVAGGSACRASSVVGGLIVTKYNLRLADKIAWDAELTGPEYWKKVTKKTKAGS